MTNNERHRRCFFGFAVVTVTRFVVAALYSFIHSVKLLGFWKQPNDVAHSLRDTRNTFKRLFEKKMITCPNSIYFCIRDIHRHPHNTRDYVHKPAHQEKTKSELLKISRSLEITPQNWALKLLLIRLSAGFKAAAFSNRRPVRAIQAAW